jgi:hypothetical protein
MNQCLLIWFVLQNPYIFHSILWFLYLKYHLSFVSLYLRIEFENNTLIFHIFVFVRVIVLTVYTYLLYIDTMRRRLYVLRVGYISNAR